MSGYLDSLDEHDPPNPYSACIPSDVFFDTTRRMFVNALGEPLPQHDQEFWKPRASEFRGWRWSF